MVKRLYAGRRRDGARRAVATRSLSATSLNAARQPLGALLASHKIREAAHPDGPRGGLRDADEEVPIADP